MTDCQITLSYKDVFGKKPSKERLVEILNTFAIEDCLLLLCEMNHRLSDSKNRNVYESHLFNNFFSPESQLRVRNFISKYRHKLLSRSNLFVLLPWIYHYASKDKEPSAVFPERSKRYDFFEAVYIACSFQDAFNTREAKALNREAEKTNNSGYSVFSFLKDLMSDFSLDTSLLSKFGNYYLIYHELFYDNSSDYQQILSSLLSEENITMEDCFLTSFLFSSALIPGDDNEEYTWIKNGRVDINLYYKDYPDLGKRVERVLKLFSKDIFEMGEIFKDIDLESTHFNLRTLSYHKHREYPIISLSRGRYLSLDPFFMLEKSGPGLLWHTIRKSGGMGGKLRQQFGNAFEEYGYTLIKNTDKPSDSKRTIAPKPKSEKGGNQEITDVLILEGNNLFLFEFKAVSIRETHRIYTRHKDFIEDIKKKLYKKKGKKEKLINKGVGQLARSVRGILSGEYTHVHIPKDIDIENIYSVLVVSQEDICFVGTHEVLNKWYLSEFKDKSVRNRANRLTLLSSSEFESFLNLSRTIEIKDILDHYHTSILYNDDISDSFREFYIELHIDKDEYVHPYIRAAYDRFMERILAIMPKKIEEV